LEENGIGRPSTFSTLVDKIQERGYVKKQDVPGFKLECSDYELENGEIFEIETTREFGNEKNKLVIQQVGVLVSQFLASHFNNLFNYDYTKDMENDLDQIAKGSKIWHETCAECLGEINKSVIALKETGNKKQEFVIDANHTYTIGRFGPVIKYTEENADGTTEVSFKPVKKDINMDKLAAGEYKLDDIVEKAHASKERNGDKVLGKYEGEDVIIKNGKFGLYVTWGVNSKSLKCLGNRPIENICLEDIVSMLYNERKVSSNISIRQGKHGAYVLYKTAKMKKPSFYPLTGFTHDVQSCDLYIIKEWLMEKHQIN
jgi:DNA topoisomerase-1